MKTKTWGKRLAFPLVVAATLAALCLPANATLHLLKPDASVPATFVGRGGVSTDGLGQAGTGGTIQADVPAGSAVVQAYLYGTYGEGTDDPSLSDRTIDFDGADVVLTTLGPDSSTDLATARADVTTPVAAKVGSGGGITNFVIGSDPEPLDGVALVVIYSNPSLPVSTIAVLDGESKQTGDTFSFDFSTPLEVDRPGFSATLAVGSGFSYQTDGGPTHECGTDNDQASTIDVNGSRLSSCAGNFDDATSDFPNDGELITVGGVGDSIDNPSDPNQLPGDGASPRVQDDELYNLVPFLANGDTSVTIETANESQDDNLFLAVLLITQETGAQKTVPVAQPDAVTVPTGVATTIDVLANDTDPDGLLVPDTVSITGAAVHGTATPDGAGNVVYTSAAGYVGPDQFQYQVCGVDQTVCSVAIVSVTVTAPAVAAVPTFTG